MGGWILRGWISRFWGALIFSWEVPKPFRINILWPLLWKSGRPKNAKSNHNGSNSPHSWPSGIIRVGKICGQFDPTVTIGATKNRSPEALWAQNSPKVSRRSSQAFRPGVSKKCRKSSKGPEKESRTVLGNFFDTFSTLRARRPRKTVLRLLGDFGPRASGLWRLLYMGIAMVTLWIVWRVTAAWPQLSEWIIDLRHRALKEPLVQRLDEALQSLHWHCTCGNSVQALCPWCLTFERDPFQQERPLKPSSDWNYLCNVHVQNFCPQLH